MYPTATQYELLTHDTDRSSSWVVLGLGLETIDHVAPFHTIANVSVTEPFRVEPTARQYELLTHEIEFNLSLLVPALGLDITNHSEPFHFIARVSMTSVPSSVDPTAMHSDALTHETDDSRSLVVPALGLAEIVAVSTTAPTDVDTRIEPNTTAINAVTATTDL